jgi:hypothetical protein
VLQKKEAKFANHKNELAWETLALRGKIARICALLTAYPRERAWKAMGTGYKEHAAFKQGSDRKIGSRTQTVDNGKYSFISRTIKLWNQLPAEVLATFPFKPHSFRNGARKVFISKRNFIG